MSEPPDAERHVRWCGDWEAVNLGGPPDYPILRHNNHPLQTYKQHKTPWTIRKSGVPIINNSQEPSICDGNTAKIAGTATNKTKTESRTG